MADSDLLEFSNDSVQSWFRALFARSTAVLMQSDLRSLLFVVLFAFSFEVCCSNSNDSKLCLDSRRTMQRSGFFSHLVSALHRLARQQQASGDTTLVRIVFSFLFAFFSNTHAECCIAFAASFAQPREFCSVAASDQLGNSIYRESLHSSR
jgi:hypothetical protein